VLADYDDFQKNRMSHLIKKLFVKDHAASQNEHGSDTALPPQRSRHYTIEI